MHVGICYGRACIVADELNCIVVHGVKIHNDGVKAMMKVMRSERERRDSGEIGQGMIFREKGNPSFDGYRK